MKQACLSHMPSESKFTVGVVNSCYMEEKIQLLVCISHILLNMIAWQQDRPPARTFNWSSGFFAAPMLSLPAAAYDCCRIADRR